MKKLLIVLGLSLFATTAFAKGGNGSDVDAYNNSQDATAIGGDVAASTGNIFAGSNLDVYSGMAIAGSVVVNPSDCDCYDDLYLTNKSRRALAVGNAAAGSIVIR